MKQLSAHRKPLQTSSTPVLLQRACACGQHTLTGAACDKCRSNHESSLQRSAVNRSTVGEVPGIVHEVLGAAGQLLDQATRSQMESRFGHDFSRVRVHTDARAAESARAVGALAYTVGRNMVFARGQYAPGSDAGRKLLAHELTHVRQQEGNTGAAHANLRVGEAGSGAEREADAVAERVVAGTQAPVISNHAAPLVQRKCEVGTPKDCSTYSDWLTTFPAKPATPGDTDITASMPADLRGLITGQLSKGGGLPDCADVAMILRHYYLQARGQSTTFRVGRSQEDSETFTLGKDVGEKEVRACVRSSGTQSFQETRSGFGLVDFYRKSVKKKKLNVTNLKELIDAGLKPGDMFVWKKLAGIGAGFQGHAQTVQQIKLPVFDPKDPTRLVSGGAITLLQGNMSGGAGLGIVQQRTRTFRELTGRDDGNADILDLSEESFFGAGPWK